MERTAYINEATKKFQALLNEQLDRAENIKKTKDFVDFKKLDKIIIGVCGGDGIGPYISAVAKTVLENVLSEEIKAGKVEIRNIEGLTIENRAAVGKAIPDDVMEELKACHVILKGPTTTPRASISTRVIEFSFKISSIVGNNDSETLVCTFKTLLHNLSLLYNIIYAFCFVVSIANIFIFYLQKL